MDPTLDAQQMKQVCDTLRQARVLISHSDNFCTGALARDHLYRECEPNDRAARRYDLLGAIKSVLGLGQDCTGLYQVCYGYLRRQTGDRSPSLFGDTHGWLPALARMDKAIEGAYLDWRAAQELDREALVEADRQRDVQTSNANARNGAKAQKPTSVADPDTRLKLARACVRAHEAARISRDELEAQLAGSYSPTLARNMAAGTKNKLGRVELEATRALKAACSWRQDLYDEAVLGAEAEAYAEADQG